MAEIEIFSILRNGDAVEIRTPQRLYDFPDLEMLQEFATGSEPNGSESQALQQAMVVILRSDPTLVATVGRVDIRYTTRDPIQEGI